ncbi:putative membrane protein [Corynebacterium jeikeium]|nr:putative membrane protein [Corynebacterium jeikeium]
MERTQAPKPRFAQPQSKPAQRQQPPQQAQHHPARPAQPPRQESVPPKQQAPARPQAPRPQAPRPAAPQPQPQPAAKQQEPKEPNKLQQWWEKEDLVTRLLAIIGGSITVVGLTFLALLAYASGILTPEGAVILAAVICGGLAVTSTIVHKKQPDGVSSSALLIVATLGGLADLWVAVFNLGWFGEALGSVLTVVICAGSLALAYAWKKEVLAVVVTAFAPLFILPAAANFLSMFPADQEVQREIHNGYFAGSLIAAAICGFAARWGRPWFKLQTTATITYICAMLLSAPFILTTFLLGVVGFALVTIISFVPPFASRQLHLSGVVAVVIIPSVCLLSSNSWAAVAFISLVTACAYIIARVNGGIFQADFQIPGTEPLPPQLANAFAFIISAGTLPIVFIIRFFQWYALDSELRHSPAEASAFGYGSIIVAVGLLLYTAAVVWGLPRMPKQVAWISLMCSFLAVFTYAPRSWVGADGMRVPDSAIVLVVSLALAVALLYRHQYLLETDLRGIAGREIPGKQPNSEMTMLVIGVVTLVLASSAIPAVAMAISTTKLSFMVAHVLISVSWMLGAVYLLYRNNSKPGLMLAIIATAKLVFYDLSVLGGLVQALAFLICGMVLLVAAVTREKPNKAPSQPLLRQPQQPQPPLPQQSQQPQPPMQQQSQQPQQPRVQDQSMDRR